MRKFNESIFPFLATAVFFGTIGALVASSITVVSKEGETHLKMHKLKKAVFEYECTTGEIPDSLNTLVDSDLVSNQDVKDAWRRAFIYKIVDTETIHLKSVGEFSKSDLNGQVEFDYSMTVKLRSEENHEQ
jgi:hypothetical protein